MKQEYISYCKNAPQHSQKLEFYSGAPRAKRASGEPWVSKSTHPRKFGSQVTVHRPSVRSTGKPMVNFTLSSSFGSIGKLILHTYWIHILHINVEINWQLSKQGICWPVSPDLVAGSGVGPSRSSIFEVIRWLLLVFKWSQAQVYFFKFILCLCATPIKILISNWSRTWKFSKLGYYRQGRQLLLTFLTMVTLWLVKIWQVSSCGKFMQHLESCLLWQLKLTEFCVNLWCF